MRLYRVEREIQKLRQRISEGDDNNRNHSVASDEKSSHGNSPVGHIQSLNSLLPLSDDRYGTAAGWVFSATFSHGDFAPARSVGKAL